MSEANDSLLQDLVIPTLERLMVAPLKLVLDPLHAALDGVPPVMWRLSICLFLLAGSLWTLRLTRESIYRGAPSSGHRCDLRI